MLEIVGGGLLKLSNPLRLRDFGLKWTQAVGLKIWVTSFLTMTGKLGGELRHQVIRQNEFVWSWTGEATQDMAELR